MQFENYTLLSYNKYNDCIYRYKCNICNGYFITKYKDINNDTINHHHYIAHIKTKKHIKEQLKDFSSKNP